jgi:hypothetical protein
MFFGIADDIKGYHIHIWSSSNSSMEKSYGGYAVLLVKHLPAPSKVSKVFTGPE